MTIGVVGRKAGMTRVFTEEGESIPVTVVSVEPNRVTQVKTVESDGYDAIQVTAGSVKANRVAPDAEVGQDCDQRRWRLRLTQRLGLDRHRHWWIYRISAGYR